MAVPALRRRSFAQFDPFFAPFFGDTSRSGAQFWVPVAEITETDTGWLVELDLPGVAKDAVDIEVHGRRVTISGERAATERDGTVRRSTRATGAFSYAVTLGTALDAEHVDAALVDGVLAVNLAKHDADQPRKVDVN